MGRIGTAKYNTVTLNNKKYKMGITSVKSIPRAITEIVVHHVKGSMTNITPDIVLLR